MNTMDINQSVSLGNVATNCACLHITKGSSSGATRGGCPAQVPDYSGNYCLFEDPPSAPSANPKSRPKTL